MMEPDSGDSAMPEKNNVPRVTGTKSCARPQIINKLEEVIN